MICIYSYHGTKETLTWKDITKDLLLLTFAASKFRSERNQAQIDGALDAVAENSGGIILSTQVSFFSTYAKVMVDKLNELGAGHLNLDIDYLTPDILAKHDLPQLYNEVNAELKAKGLKVAASIDECYDYM